MAVRSGQHHESTQRFNLEFMRDLTCDIVHGVAFLHRIGLMHCDLKPENILMVGSGGGGGGGGGGRPLLKIVDFGSTCFTTDRRESYIQSRTYRAPEVCLGLPYDGGIDVWSIGCILFELWTGSVLFSNRSVGSMLARMEGILGPIPAWMLLQGRNTSKYYTSNRLLYETSDDVDVEEEEEEEKERESFVYILQCKKTTLKRRLRPPNNQFGDDFYSLLYQMLELDPEKRITIQEAAKHSFLCR